MLFLGDPAAGTAHAPTFPATMPLAGAIFVVMLAITVAAAGPPAGGRRARRQ
jgi:hypothetical protein